MKKLKVKQAVKSVKIENLKTHVITVQNAEGEPDTEAEIIIQNKIKYTPKVSVIIPVYNTEEYLRECLDSVINQTLKEIEIICVDDGSTDSSLEILKEYATKDNRFTIITQKNLHAGVARNAGLTVAKGEYIHFLDSDDWIEKETYNELYALSIEKKCNIIKFKSFCFDNIEKKVINSYFTNMGAIKNEYFDKKLILKDNIETIINVSDAPWSGIYNANFLQKNNIKFDNLLCANDTSFFYRCIIENGEIYLNSQRYVYYRINNKTSLIGIRAHHFDCQIKQYKNICNIIKDKLSEIQEECIKKHLLHAILYRYQMYINKDIPYAVKNKIRCETKEFISTINQNLITNEYKDIYKELITEIPSISIIIPVYNTEKYLRQCLDSIINQTLKNIEIICINDASTDNSLEILNEYAQKDGRIIVINNERNLGAPGAVKNIGIQNAKGEYIGFVDSDDYVDLNYFEELYKAAVKNNADVAASTILSYVWDNDIKSIHINCPDGILITPKKKEHLIKISGSNCNKIYRKNLIWKNKIKYCEIRNIAEDNIFSCCAMICANKIITTSKTGYFYRKRMGSITANPRTVNDFAIFSIYQEIDKFVTKYDKNYLPIVNARKIQDLKWFYNECIKKDKEAFKQELKKYFPQIYNEIITQEIIISLTSYPARINTVNQTIESLLNQTMKADKVILWLAPEQFPNKEKDLPQQLLELQEKGLTIDWYHDIKSYKKLIPTLKKYPDAVIVTADDDNIYQPDFLEKLYNSYRQYPKDVQCHRVTKIYYNHGFGTIAGGKEYYLEASYLNKVVGLGGVLYPPHCFYKDVLDEKLIMKLAPTNDDEWFWFQAMLNGIKVRVVDKPLINAHYIDGTQQTGLTNINDKGPKRFWIDFNRILQYYPTLKSIMIKENSKYPSNNALKSRNRLELESFYYRRTGHPLNLENPRTYNEKIQWLKLYESTPIKTRLADKYLVRDWVKEKIGEEYLIPLLGVYDKFEEIDFDKLPNQFVIKCNHGCGYNIIVKDKSQLNLSEIKTKLDKWMNENFAFHNGVELQYLNIQPKIIIEDFIENKGTDDLYDYKFWCFNGKVEYIQFLSERNLGGLKMAFYDRAWHKQHFVYSHPLDKKNMPRPDNLEKMIMLAEALSMEFNHVRVDFYRLNDGTIYFGEMTFTSASGICKWNDEKVNLKLGNMIKLPKLAYNIDTGEYYKLPKKSKLKPWLLFPYNLCQKVYLTHKEMKLYLKLIKKQLLKSKVDVRALGKNKQAIRKLKDIIFAQNQGSEFVKKNIRKLAKKMYRKLKKRKPTLIEVLRQGQQNQESLLQEIRSLKQMVEYQSAEIKQLQRNLTDQ